MSERSEPIVATVLIVGDQRHPWRLAELHRRPALYHTPTTVRLQLTPKTQETKHQHQVYCLPSDADWETVKATQARLQQALDDLAAGLHDLGSYASRLEAAGGMKRAPNPLSSTVIRAPDPDNSDYTSWWTDRLVPRIERTGIRGHTPKMLRDARYADGSVFAQRDHFVCETDADWARIEALRQTAQAKADAWEQLLGELGTYERALFDGRYTRKEACMQAAPAPSHVRPANSIAETDLDAELAAQLVTAGYRWEHAKQTPDGRWHHVISSRNTALLRNDQVLMRRERLEALLTSDAALTVAPPAGALSTGLQSVARDYIAAREKAGRALLEMASYLALARSMAKHGEWYAFLQATGTSEDQADRLLDIDRKASENPDYADAVRRNFLSPSTAALLARPSTPAAVVEQVLRTPEPPSVRQVEQQIKQARGVETKSRNVAGNAPALPPDYQHMAEVEKILATLDQWDDGTRLARCQEAYDQARQISDVTLYNRAFVAIDRAMDSKATVQPAGSVAPLETRGVRLGPGQPAPEPWPLPPPGWRWRRNGGVCQLIDNADGWSTANYNSPERALAEAERRMLSRAEETLGRVPAPAQISAVRTRPRRPQSADVSAQLSYLDQLEAYTTTLEQRVVELERQLSLREREVLA